MGRTEPSHAPLSQQSFRKDQRAKHARSVINKNISQLLASDTRARKGIEQAHLFTNSSFDLKSNSEGNSKRQSAKSQRSRRNSSPQERIEAASLNEATKATKEDRKPLKISIHVSDTLTAARHLHEHSRSKKNVAILNMASPLRPGGGVLNGATSQEESLCTRTTLLPTLKEQWYRLPDVGGIWSPDILVFRVPGVDEDEDLPKSHRFYVDVVTAAMTRFPDIKEVAAQEFAGDDASGEGSTSAEHAYANQKDRELALEKMRAVVKLLEFKKTEKVVLGAWGCGAYGNPVGEISRAWKKVLLGSRGKVSKSSDQDVMYSSIKDIIIAVKDPHLAAEFAKHWDDDIAINQTEKQSQGTVGPNQDQQNVEELQQKIEALEVQLNEVKTPMLRQGLENTLQTLKDQLANTYYEGAKDESDDE